MKHQFPNTKEIFFDGKFENLQPTGRNKTTLNKISGVNLDAIGMTMLSSQGTVTIQQWRDAAQDIICSGDDNVIEIEGLSILGNQEMRSVIEYIFERGLLVLPPFHFYARLKAHFPGISVMYLRVYYEIAITIDEILS